jgi:hypothetical protein
MNDANPEEYGYFVVNGSFLFYSFSAAPHAVENLAAARFPEATQIMDLYHARVSSPRRFPGPVLPYGPGSCSL